MRIRWETLEPGQYEDMVSILLSNMHPDMAERIDGSGGDGGLDVRLAYDDGVDGFELKSFTGRLKGAKREQVKRSLRKAASLGLREWALVVPIDPTPKEAEWFDGLRGMIDCPIRWLGKTWLESQFAERPHVARYFLGRKEDEVIDLLRELREEEAGLVNGVPDAAERAARVARRANELDPHYRFSIETDGDSTFVKIIPRYPGAERDRPIAVKTQFTFPASTDEGRAAFAEFAEHVKFGTPVKISGSFIEHVSVDAPAGLGGEWTGGMIEMTSLPPSDPGRRMAIAGKDALGTYAPQVALDMEIKHRGEGGVVMEGTDRSGSLKVRMKIDSEEHKVQAQVTILGNLTYFPHEILPLARLLEYLRDHEKVALLASNGAEIGTVAGAFDKAKDWATQGFAELVEELALIQTKSGRIEEVKPELSLEDLENIVIGGRWARNEPVIGTWKNLIITLTDDLDEDARRALATDESAMRLVSPGPGTVTIQGVVYQFGLGTEARFTSGRLSDLCRRKYRNRVPPAGAVVTFVPGNSERIETLVQY